MSLCLTYILKLGANYKIGKTTNLNVRLAQYRTHNPEFDSIEIELVVVGDIENFLLYLAKPKKIQGEWFKLEEDDISQIKYKIAQLSD